VISLDVNAAVLGHSLAYEKDINSPQVEFIKVRQRGKAVMCRVHAGVQLGRH
jgi:hypothetical protein